MNFQHKDLARGRWEEFSFITQMANIGSELERALSWKNKNKEYSARAINRTLELLYLTIRDPKNKKHLKEITRLREIIIDYFYLDNIYRSSDEFWHKYFYAFAWASRIS